MRGGGELTLLIACILIYHFNMQWWWYPLAAIIWAGSFFARKTFFGSRFAFGPDIK
jgi:hypothetical protein